MAPFAPSPAGPLEYAAQAPDEPQSPDLVLVHGWCCDRTVMEPLATRLARTHRVLTLDLRGHGGSLDREDDGSMGVGCRRDRHEDAEVTPQLRRVSIEDYAGDVLDVAYRAGLRRPVVVGHSMGALVALAAARADRRGPADRQASGAVLLDPAPVVNPEAKQFWVEAAQRVSGDTAGRWRKEFAESLFLPQDRIERLSVIETMVHTPSVVAAAAARAMARFDGDRVLRDLADGPPLLAVHVGSLERELAEVARAAGTRLVSGQVVCSGHFLQLDVPEQVEAMMRRWLEVSPR